jgi:hypothetical protein
MWHADIKKRIALFSAVVLLSVAGCKSDPNKLLKDKELGEFDKAPLYGMIYDEQSRPARDVVLTMTAWSPLDQETPDATYKPVVTRSDVNGRFVFNGLKRGRYTVTLIKPDHEPLSVDFIFTNKSQILYVRMTSFSGLLAEAEEALAANNAVSAGRWLSRAAALKPDHPGYLFLAALAAWKSGDRAGALGFLDRLDGVGAGNEYTEALRAKLSD